MKMFGIGRGRQQAGGRQHGGEACGVRSHGCGRGRDEPEHRADRRRGEASGKVPEKPKTTLLAEGSVFEGTLHTKGDVEIAGVFKGDFSEGNVKLFANIEGNVQGGNVELVTSSVQGDVSAKELLKIGPQSVVGGNIKTKDMICSGRIVGNVESSGRVTLTTRQRPHGRPDRRHHRRHGGRSDGGPLQDRKKISCGYTGQIGP